MCRNCSENTVTTPREIRSDVFDWVVGSGSVVERRPVVSETFSRASCCSVGCVFTRYPPDRPFVRLAAFQRLSVLFFAFPAFVRTSYVELPTVGHCCICCTPARAQLFFGRSFCKDNESTAWCLSLLPPPERCHVTRSRKIRPSRTRLRPCFAQYQ